MRRSALLLLSFLAVIVVLAGCGGGGGSSSSGGKDTTDDADWTILVYLNADNDLEQYGILNMNQMEMVGSTGRVKIVVQMDRSPSYDSTNGNWTGCRRYLVTRDTDRSVIRSTVLQDMGDVDTGSPDTLRQFIAWGQQTYPASHYCLVIWNHGSGWRSATTTSTITRNVSFDDTSGTSIKTTDLAYALSGSPQPVELVAFDASLMQMLEVAYEMRSSASYLVGSEESPPGDGYVYDAWLAPLAANPGVSALDLGKLIAQKYVQSYVNKYDVTQSVLALTRMPDVAAAVNNLGAAIAPHADTDAAALASARQVSQRYAFPYYKDLLDYALKVKSAVPDPAVATACTELQTALGAAVVYEGHTGSSVSNSHGLSIYVPAPGEYLDRYTTLGFCQDYPNWAAWLKGQKQ